LLLALREENRVIRLAKQMVRRLAIALGFELRGVGTSGSEQRLHMGDFLTHFAKTGFLPKTIVDCGVADGTYDLYKAFPEAFLLLIEPLEENTEAIQSILTKYNGKFILGAAAAESGKIQFNVHGDHLEGSSMLFETMGAQADGAPRVVAAVRIDDLVAKEDLQGPFLIKVDVQGAELDVLKGAPQTLKNTEMVILEVSFFEFMKGAPQFSEVISFMKNIGFVAYDFFDRSHRPLDGALGQVDIAFVKEKGIFRKNHSYATMDQWNEITRKDS